MPVELNDVQDVFKDVGSNVEFLMLKLNRLDQAKEKAAVQALASRIPAVIRSMNVRKNDGDLKMTFGLSNAAWDYLFPNAKKPKELETFTPIEGPKYTAPATDADLFLHVRANEQAIVFEVVDQLMGFIKDFVSIVDDTHGFRYFEGRAAVGFIDGTENPVGSEAFDWAVIGDEDPDFAGGSYAFGQKYTHNMDAWKKMSTEEQEKTIGRKKFSDLELDEKDKHPHAHNIISKDVNEDGSENSIVRMNVPYNQDGVTGTYFIGYARHWQVTHRMVMNMFMKTDRLLDFSTAIKSQLFFIPSYSVLEKIANDEL